MTSSDRAPAAVESAPTRQSTFVGKLLALGGVVVSCAFLANVGAGVLFEIPDNLPVIGNLDEVFFTGVLLASLSYLGIPLIPNFRAAGQAYTRIEGPKP